MITPKDFWKAVGLRATAAAIVTTAGRDGPAGFVALSVAHFSPEPPLITVAIGRETSALAVIIETGAFAVNLLARDAEAVWERFSARDAPKGAARFEGLETGTLETGAPVLSSAFAVYDCRVARRVEEGNTVLVFGELVAMAETEAAAPLVFFGRGVSGLA